MNEILKIFEEADQRRQFSMTSLTSYTTKTEALARYLLGGLGDFAYKGRTYEPDWNEIRPINR